MRWVIIAEELSAVGWRLAGARPLIAPADTVAERLAEAQSSADLILITGDCARQLPPPVRAAAGLSQTPLLAVIPGLQSGSEPPDLEREVNHVLGIAL